MATPPPPPSNPNSSHPKQSLTRPSNTREFDDKPLWNHVKVISTPQRGGGNRVWSCNYCSKTVTGSYSKVKAHLLRIPNQGVEVCKALSDDVQRALNQEHEKTEWRKTQNDYNARKKAEYVSLPCGSDLSQPKRKKGSLENSFNMQLRDTADKEAARMFYASALPFNLAISPYFRQYSRTLANGNLSGYTPPTYNRLRTTLLAQEKEHINRLLQPIRDSWRKKGASIVSDGWSDRQRRPLINIMAASSGGAMFIKAIDASGNIKDADYIASTFDIAIKDVGKDNVVQIISDNASNYKAAGAIIETRYPHIFWTPCVVHSLNLALKSICDPSEKSLQFVLCKWIPDLVKEIQNIRNFIVNHGMALFIYNKHSKLSLLRVADTRFASSIIMAKRMKDVKSSLEAMVMDSDWKTYREGNYEAKAQEVKQCIVNDAWWDKLDFLLSFTEPIINMLRAADTDTPILHLIYDMWDTMIENVKKIVFEYEGIDMIDGNSDFFNAVHQILEARWTKSNTPLHCMAHSLVPKYYCEAWLQEETSGGVQRVSPHEDNEVSLNRSKCFKRLFQDPNDLRKVNAEFGAFCSGSDFFNQSHIIEARMFEDPISWWANYGASTPLLQALAFKLLSQPASSSCCERNWSTYSIIQSIKRNKLEVQRAEDLVFVHCNLRLISRKQEEYKNGPTKYWDLVGDNMALDGDSIELPELSLTEPQLEMMTINDDEEE